MRMSFGKTLSRRSFGSMLSKAKFNSAVDRDLSISVFTAILIIMGKIRNILNALTTGG